MSNDKFTREQLNNLDKDFLITMMLKMQDQISEQTVAIQNLTEQIAIMNTKTFGKKSEKFQIDADQLNFFTEIFNEAESLIDGQLSIEPSMDEVIVPAHKRRKRKGKIDEDLMDLDTKIIEHTLTDEEQEFARNDVNISRQTMANWVITSAERYISLVYDRMKEELLKSPVIHADETPVMVSKDGREGMHKNYMWVYRSGSMCKANQAVLL